MSHGAPTGRQHLSADARFRVVHTGFDHIPEQRPGDADMLLVEALMAACAMFSLKSSSLLALDQARAEGTLRTMYGIERVPGDTPMRTILEPVSPESLRPLFQSVFRPRQRGQALEALRCLDGDY